ncbi:MAG: hypothetical protein KC561_07890 [Myxococcales bacterium]|nr:hypothetical protein [Myxococcales bacterium]
MSKANDQKNGNDIEALHRELIEARNLAIKTDNLVKNLNADIKQIAKRQDAYQRRYLFNSAVAYVLFVVVIFTLMYLVFDTRVSSYESERTHLEARNESLQEDLDTALDELERRREADDRAFSFFELIQSGRREEVVAQFNEVQAQLSNRAMIELFRDRVQEINYELAEDAFRTGMGHAQEERWSEARDMFLDSMNHLELAPWGPELRYELGLSLYELDDYEGAIHFLDEALATEELDEAQDAWGRYVRGQALQDTGRLSEAVEAFADFRDRYGAHRYAGRALHYINRIEREIDRGGDDDDDDQE